MAATISRRTARAATTTTRQGLRSQMRITKTPKIQDPKPTPATKTTPPITSVKREPTEPPPTIHLSSPPPSSAAATAAVPAKNPIKASYTIGTTPFPRFPRPTPEDCLLAHTILTSLHGPRPEPRSRPAAVKEEKDDEEDDEDEKGQERRVNATCGASPSVLDALVRTILSQNTTTTNSTRAKLAMDAAYGPIPPSSSAPPPSSYWAAVYAQGPDHLRSVIACGGLATSKSRTIYNILHTIRASSSSSPTFSLDHLFHASDADAMAHLLSFPGVGPKTAACVLLFCLRRPLFAVDTHVHRLAGILRWRPPQASRLQAQAHLDTAVPDHLKYSLHILLIAHGKTCPACRAKPMAGRSCELRDAFAAKYNKEEKSPIEAK